MSPTTIWNESLCFGKRTYDDVSIYLSAPSWDCEWYWSYGYLGNQNEHYHLDDYETPYWLREKQNRNMYDALKNDYILAPKIYENLWLFCEFTETIYSFKTIAEVYKRGGSHYTHSKDEQKITQDLVAYERINNIILPQLFDKLYTIITPKND